MGQGLANDEKKSKPELNSSLKVGDMGSELPESNLPPASTIVNRQ